MSNENEEYLRKKLTVGNNVYHGVTLNLTSLTSDANWKIWKVSTIGGEESVTFANNSQTYNQIWDDVLSLFSDVGSASYGSCLYNGLSNFHSCGASYYDIDRLTPFTIGLIFKHGAASNAGFLLSKMLGAGTFKGWGVTKLATSNKLRFNQRNTASSNEVQLTTSTALNINEWYFLVITGDGTGTAAGTKFYINSVSDSFVTDTNNLSATSVDVTSLLQFGARAGATFYHGNLDEIYISNTWCASQSEVTELYNSYSPMNLNNFSNYASIGSWWKMAENLSGLNVVDEKGIINATANSIVNNNYVASYVGSVL